jgi:hypothetical protein
MAHATALIIPKWECRTNAGASAFGNSFKVQFRGWASDVSGGGIAMRVGLRTRNSSAVIPAFLLYASICIAQLPAPPAPVVNENDQAAVPVYLLDPAIRDLPDAPVPREEHKVGFWSFRNWDEPDLRSNREIMHDKVFLTAHGIWLASIVYDVELTHQGLAHHKCVERGADGYPSRGELYTGDLIPFGVGTFLDFLFIKYVSKPYILPITGATSFVHFRGGTRWLRNCW